MKVTLYDDLYDVTDIALIDSAESAFYDNVNGIISEEKQIRLIDEYGSFSPFIGASVLGAAFWRNQTVRIYDDDETITFEGVIFDISQSEDDAGLPIILILARSRMANVLEFPVEENDKSTHSGFLTAGVQQQQNSVIAVDTGSTDIPAGAVIGYNAAMVPTYLTQATQGSPTNQIDLDRPLEESISDNTSLIVAVPVVKTFPAAIQDTLEAAFFADGALTAAEVAAFFGTSFASYHASDSSAGYQVWLNVRKEQNISLRDHLRTLMNMSDYYIYQDETGKIQIARLAYDGSATVNSITDAELMPPSKVKFDTSRLVYRYDTLYRSGASVEVASATAPSHLIQKWKAEKPFQPIPAKDSSIKNYQYLYNDLTSAQYFGQAYLDYYQYPRPQIVAALKPHVSLTPAETFKPKLFTRYNVTTEIAGGVGITDEPGRVVGYSRSDSYFEFSQFVIELTKEAPALPV